MPQMLPPPGSPATKQAWHEWAAGVVKMRERPSRKIYITAGTSCLYNELKSSEVYNVKRDFTVVIERDEDGIYVASVPELVGCHTQAKTLDELRERITEAVQLYLEVESEKVGASEFIGIQRVGVSV